MNSNVQYCCKERKKKENYVCVLNKIKQTTLELYYDDDDENNNNDDDVDYGYDNDYNNSDKRTGTINCY